MIHRFLSVHLTQTTYLIAGAALLLTLSLLVSCTTIPSAGTQGKDKLQYQTKIDHTGTPVSLDVKSIGVVLGSYAFQTGPVGIRLKLRNGGKTPLQIQWKRSEIIQSGGVHSAIFLHSQGNYKEVARSEVLISGDQIIDTLTPSSNVQSATATGLALPGGTEFAAHPMAAGPITVFLVYNDSPGFTGPGKSLTIHLIPTTKQASAPAVARSAPSPAHAGTP